MTTFEQIGTLMESSGNYKKYREEFASISPPAIPYFGMIYLIDSYPTFAIEHPLIYPLIASIYIITIAVYLRDLTFIEDGNQNYISEGIVNFQKMKMLAKALSELQRYQRRPFSFNPQDDIHK